MHVEQPVAVLEELLAAGPFIDAVTEFRWLPATPANLARLNAPIPPGFRVSGHADGG